jgi:hypothetical protein
LIEDARDGRKCMIGRVALTQNFSLHLQPVARATNPLPRRVSFLALECG